MTYAEFAQELQGTSSISDTDLEDELTLTLWRSGLVMEDDCEWE